MSTAAGVGQNPNVNPQAAQFQFSGKDALIGGLIGSIFGMPIAGAGLGSVLRSLLKPSAKDMDAAYDAQQATKGGQTFDFGDLKGMFDGLMGQIRDFAGGMAAQHQQAQAKGEFSNQPPPADQAEAQQRARPAQGPEVERQAQSQSNGVNWGKVLKWGAVGLAGITLLNNIPFLGGMGMPGYGMGMGMGMGGFW